MNPQNVTPPNKALHLHSCNCHVSCFCNRHARYLVKIGLDIGL